MNDRFAPQSPDPFPLEGKGEPLCSRIRGFYKLDAEARRAALLALDLLKDDEMRAQLARGGLPLVVADKMSENVVSTHGLPLSVALNFRVNGRDVLVPMAVEEPSIVAAASNAARLVRETGGFFGEADAPIMTAQIQFDDVRAPADACARVLAERVRICADGDAAIPRMVARGGGCRDVDARVLDAAAGVLVVHVYVDVGDAMGANVVDTVAEALAPVLHEIVGGSVGLRILSNLTTRRMVRIRARIEAASIGGDAAADAIVRAGRFAELDPFRACTHNKGFMNGVDAAAIALGQDFRAIEAGAHAYASLRPAGEFGGRSPSSPGYGPLSIVRRTPSGIVAEAELPLAVGTVGGSTRAHPGVRVALALARVAGARELAVLLAAAGLATNLASLKALAGEGIQRGHMRLHERKQPDEAPCRDARPPLRVVGGAS